MHTCPLASPGQKRLGAPASPRPVSHDSLAWTLYVSLEVLAHGLRWHGLLQLLSAIPDSNEDFILF